MLSQDRNIPTNLLLSMAKVRKIKSATREHIAVILKIDMFTVFKGASIFF
jgi:hypothetical protein